MSVLKQKNGWFHAAPPCCGDINPACGRLSRALVAAFDVFGKRDWQKRNTNILPMVFHVTAVTKIQHYSCCGGRALVPAYL